MQAYRKSDLAQFSCRTQDVCGEEDGDLNPDYFKDANTLGEFRKIFEPHWNTAIDDVQQRKISGDAKFVISAGWSAFTSTTPITMVHGAQIYERELRSVIPLIVEKEKIPLALSMKVEIDPSFLKSVVTKNLLNGTWLFFNQNWTIIHNDTNVFFITSDSPSAILPLPIPGGRAARLLPISPHCCVYAEMDMARGKETFDLSRPPKGDVRHVTATKKQVKIVNRLTVMHASDLVFSKYRDAGIAALVFKYQNYGVQVIQTTLPTPDGSIIGASLHVGRKKVLV